MGVGQGDHDDHRHEDHHERDRRPDLRRLALLGARHGAGPNDEQRLRIGRLEPASIQRGGERIPARLQCPRLLGRIDRPGPFHPELELRLGERDALLARGAEVGPGHLLPGGGAGEGEAGEQGDLAHGGRS